MNENWRLILQKDTSAAYGLAVDETCALSVARNYSPPILHLYNFLPCVVLGRYQSVDQAIDVQECRRQGIEINRRHTGGGTVLMGPEQLALGFAVPRHYPGVGPSINDIFTNLGGVLRKALGELGIKARFRPKNDIEVNRKKIAGLSASLEERDIAFFHTSLLLDFDFKLMLKIFKLPIQKLSGRGISCFKERMTTIRAEKRRRIDLPSFQSIVRKAFEEHFGVTFRIDTLNQWELEQLDALLRRRYTNPEWIYSRRHPGVSMGFASTKTRGGLVELGITLSGEVIEAAYLSGDFLSTGAAVNQIEAALRYCAASKKQLLKRLRPVMDIGSIFKVDRDTIIKLVLTAAARARTAREKALKEAERARKAEEKKKEMEARAMRAALKKWKEGVAAEERARAEAEKEEAAAEKVEPPKKAKAAKKKGAEKPEAAAKKKKAAAKKVKPVKKVKAAAGKAAKKAKPRKAKPAAKKAAVKKKKVAAKKAKPAKKKVAAKKAAVKKKKAAAKKAGPTKKVKPAKKAKAAVKKKKAVVKRKPAKRAKQKKAKAAPKRAKVAKRKPAAKKKTATRKKAAAGKAAKGKKGKAAAGKKAGRKAKRKK